MIFNEKYFENFVTTNLPMQGTVTCMGRFISALEGDFPSWREIYHSMRGLRRFCGQQIDFCLDWNVLKHSWAVAILCKNIIVGIFHDYPEMFTGDIPTPYKTPEIRAFEKQCHKRLGAYLTCIWPKFDESEFLKYPYKPADSIMLDIEAIHVIKAPEHYHKKYFLYNKNKYGGIDFDKTVVTQLYHDLVAIPSDSLYKYTVALLDEITDRFQRTGYDYKLVETLTDDFFDYFDFEKMTRERMSRKIFT